MEFLVKLAFRRDYTWGEFFGEEWTNEGGSATPTYFTQDVNAAYQQFNAAYDYQTDFTQGKWKIRFPSGYHSSYSPLPLSTIPAHQVVGEYAALPTTLLPPPPLKNPRARSHKMHPMNVSVREAQRVTRAGVALILVLWGDAGTNYPNDQGRMCDNPYDDGLLPTCNGTSIVATDTAIDPRTGNSIPYYPYYQGGLSTSVLPSGLGAVCSCSVDDMKNNYGTCPGSCTMQCTTATQESAFFGGSTVCGPWAYSYGFYTGVETDGGDPDYHKTLEITLNEINSVADSKIGNFITGEGKIEQQYPSPLGNGGEPWVAYFTGGDRIGKAAAGLQNNYGGRFRLEISVNLMCHVSNTCWQRSARATSLPVVPIPYTGRNGFSLYDYSFSTFRIAAYDPDIGDDVFFYHANNQKYGVLVGHGIPEGDYPNNPTPLEYNNARQAVIDSSCGGSCNTCPSPLTLEGPGLTTAVINDFCVEYPEWTVANVGHHTAGPPPRLFVDPYTGVVHWQTGASPFNDDIIDPALGVGGYSVPAGFNPGGVGTPYRFSSYDGWVYNRDTFSYQRYSDFSDCGGAGGAYTGDTCTTQKLDPGFYNLVVEIRSNSGDPCLNRDASINVTDRCMSMSDIMEAELSPGYVGTNGAVNMEDPMLGPYTPAAGQSGLLSSKRGYTTVPLDFLLYLYPAMHMCANCNSSTAGPDQYVGSGVVTFADSTATYGFDVTQQINIVPPNVDKYIHAQFEGTGRCIICGGSETNSSQVAADPTVCQSCLQPNIATCVKNTRPYWINKDYSINDDPYTPAPPGWDHTDTRPSGDPTSEPAWGELDVAQVSAFKGSVVEFDLVAADDDDCVEIWIYDTGLYRGDELDYCNANVNQANTNSEACSALDLGNEPGILDDLFSDFDPSINMFDMWLGPHQPAYIPNYNGTKPSVLGEPGKTVRRKFKWPAVTAWPATLKSEYDPRPVESTVCFFAFDGYLFSDFRCVRITLNTEQQIYWSDYRPGLDYNQPWNVVQDEVGFNTGTFTTTDSAGDVITVTAPLTLANQTHIVVNVGDLVQFDLQAKQGSAYDPLDIFISQGVMPEGATFTQDTTYNNDPTRYTFAWRPTKGQECEYQICFLATNIRGTEYPMTVGYNDLVSRLGPRAPSVASYTPAASSFATAPFIDERCYTIEVTDTAAHINGGAFVDVDATGASDLVSALDGDCGYSVGGWFYPEGSTSDMALVSIGYTTGALMTAAHQLRWMYDAESDDVEVGTDNVIKADTGKQYRSLALYEIGSASPVAKTVPVECDGGWHYFFLTIGSDKTVSLYLDGVALAMSSEDSHEFMAPLTGTGSVTTFPGAVSIPAGSSAAFRLGADNMGNNFDGWLNDIRAYSRLLTAEEVAAQMFATCSNYDAKRDTGECLALDDADMAASAKVGLELWLNFNDANNANPSSVDDPNNAGVVHGCTSDALPTDASYSRYLACKADRDTRDLTEWGGTYEYCNDYVALVGLRTQYYPDYYREVTDKATDLPRCPTHMCYAKTGPVCAGTPATCLTGIPATFTGTVTEMCSYQCADSDNSFHGSLFNSSNPIDLLSDVINIPFVSSEATLGAWEVVGDLNEMDAPYSPYKGEMTMFGGATTTVIADKSGKTGRSASASLGTGNVGTATFEYKVSPQFNACPATPIPNVVHVDGGQEIVLRGKNFAESKFLKCHFSGMGSVPATVIEYDARGDLRTPSAVKCQAPGGFGAATAAALEVSNNGDDFTDFNIPVYFTESAAYFDGANLMEINPMGTLWLDNGLSIGMWFNMHEPLAVRPTNGVAASDPVILFALEWAAAVGSVDEHLAVTYNTMSADPSIEIYASGSADPAMSTIAAPLTQGTTGWQYIMMSMSSEGETTLYLNGNEVGKVNTTVPGTDAKLWMGGRIPHGMTVATTTLGGYSEYVGFMDELSVFTKEVSPCELKQWMWGNLTRDYNCPTGKHDDGASKDVYSPVPEGLMAHFSFNGLAYDHGTRLTGSMDMQTWDTAKFRYITVDTSAGWVEPVTEGVRINGVLTSGVAGATTVQYGSTLQIGSNATQLPGLKFVTVPFLPPSFNAPRRKICGNVRMATSSREQAVASIGASLSEDGNFMFADINYINNATGGYSGATYMIGEPQPVPNRCEENHGFLVDSMVPVEGYYMEGTSLNQCSESGVAVYGFGFAKSMWLTCMQGDAEGELSPTAANFINAAEVRCTAEATELPYKYKFAVSNSNVPEDEECDDAPEPVVVETPEELHTKDLSLYFNGVDDFAMANGISSQVATDGVTFGAWFFPTRAVDTTNPEQEPIVAFGTECGSVLPLFNSGSGAPPAAMVVGATYSNGQVCLTSDLPYYSKQEIPAHPELDLPNKWDSSYGLLDTTNSSLCLPAAPDQWHYVEIAVNPTEILFNIPSDEPKVSYLATLSVDGTKIGGDEDGDADSSLRVPSLPVDGGIFYIGGIQCVSVTASANTNNPNDWEGLNNIADYHKRFFQGMIDEVRVYRGVKDDVQWVQKAEPSSDLLAYYTFSVTRGDNQRRQTPHCEEFDAGSEPDGCIKGGAYFAREVEFHWINQPAGLRYNSDNLATYPRPTGYYPVTRGSPLRPTVYPQLITHTDPILNVGVDICDMPTVSDASYAGTTKAHQNLASDSASFPLNYAAVTAHPYAQGGPSRFSQFLPADSTLYNYAAGPDITMATQDGGIYSGLALNDNPDYRYMEVPWYAATIEGIDEEVSALDGGREVTVTGYNMAPSAWLACKFRGLKYDNHTFSLDDDFASYKDVLAYNGFLDSQADTIKCPFPGTTDPSDTETLGSDWLKVPSLVSMQLVNPKAVDSEMVMFKEMGLEFGGNAVTETYVTYGSDNTNGAVTLTCPGDLRMDKVLFASYGRPTNRCNRKRVLQCNGTYVWAECDWMSWKATKSCDSDANKASGFSASVVNSYCFGKQSCTIPAKEQIFGDSCSGRNKWLAVAVECTDRWMSKDYAILSDARAATLGALLNPVADELGEYTFSAWVKPGSAVGQQAVASFGCKNCAKMNRAVLQWVGMEDNAGIFHYYDDYINDVIMKRPDGSDITLAADQWYHVAFTVDKDNCGTLYLNGHSVASFSTASRPVGGPGVTQSPTFTLGMDLDDSLHPKEYFTGMVDEVRIFKKALTDEEVFSTTYWTMDMGNPLSAELVAYYKFNNMAEQDSALAHDETANELHLTLATSVVDEWDPATLTFSIAGAVPQNHMMLAPHGAAWFPATTYALDTDFTTAPLGAGLTSFDVLGVNFVKGTSRVYYDGQDVSESIVEMSDTEITMLLPDAECEDGDSSVYVSNVETCPPLATPEETISQEASVPDLQNGLICYFPFFGNAMDWSGNGNDAELVDGADLVHSRNGFEDQAYSFDGDDVIKVPDCVPAALTGKSIQTVAMWVKYADIAFPEVCSSYLHFEEEIGFSDCKMEDHAIMTNAWKLITGIAHPNGTKVYVNGKELVSTSGKLPEYLDVIHRVMLLQEIGGDDFVGEIDDVWIYDRVLCDDEVMQLYETQMYAIEMDGEVGLKAPIMSGGSLGSPGLKVTLISSTAAGGPAANSAVVSTIVQLPADNSELVNRAGSGVLDLDTSITVPTVSATDAYSMVVEGTVYAPFSSTYTFSVSASDEVYCWLKSDDDTVLFTITSSQKDTLRTMERDASLAAGEWYALRCAYTKLPDDNSITTMGSFGIRWRSSDGQINGPLTAPYVRTGGPSELVVAAWIHPYEVDGRVGVLSLMGDGDETDEMARFGLSIVDGALTAAFYTGDEGATCDAMYYREVQSWKSAIVEDKWQHVAVTYDGTTMTFFVDGRMTDVVVYSTSEYVDMNSDVELVLGADASSEMFEGQVYSVAIYNKVPMGAALEAWIMDLWECPISEPEDNLILSLLMNEGVGMVAKDFSVNPDHPEMRVFGDGMLTSAATWVDATCDSLGADVMSVEYAGQGLIEGLAGQCMVFTIQAYDKCGRMRMSGGDGFTVEVVGPLHLHSEIYELTVGDGIEDMEDGSYLVHFTREISGYYLIYVKLDGEIVPNSEGADATKTYVHPYVTDATTTYMFDEPDMLGLDELRESCAAVPVAYVIQTVDAYQNLRTLPCDTDAFDVSFSGPYDFDGKVTNMEDGTFMVNYNAEVAGPYQMRVTATVAAESGTEEKPVSHYGGRTCHGWAQSELDYCTLYDSPDLMLAGEDYPICIQVHECGSLRTFKDSIYASFPDTDDLDLEGPFTMAAWVKPIPEVGEAARQYILSKQSEYSGKGYWLALLPAGTAGAYTLELGIYVGSENYRIVTAPVSIPTDGWMRVGATYDGQAAHLFAGGMTIASESWMDEAALFQRRNAQPLRVGKAFSGLIDNVMLYSAALPEKFDDESSARCPAVDSDSHDDLIAYYRFNEGATRDMDGNLVPQNSAWATKDSSPKDNDGFVGLFSDETGQNKEMTIKCPAGYVISEVLFANYGSSKGGYGTYEKDECGAANSMSYIEDKCLGLQTCKVLAAYSVFGNPCKHAAKTLAVNAICALPMPNPDRTQWAIGEPAPHWVGTAAPTEMECPFDDLDSLPMHFQALLANGTCDDWDMSKATAGETEFFLLRLKDMCGYHNRYPQKVDDYIQIVDTSIMLLDAGDAYEPVFKSLSSAELTYPLEFVPPEIDTCGVAQEPEADAMFVDFMWGGDHGGYDMYCSRYRDLYLGMYTPTAAHEEATLSLNLGEVDGEVFKTVTVDIMPADINVAASTTCAPTETAPDCDSDTCEDIMAEAGVEAMFEFVAKDEFGNKLRSWDDLADLSLMVEGGQSAIHTVMQGSEEGVYEFYVIFPHEGNFTVTLKAGDDTGCSFMAYVSPAQPHMAVVYNVVPEVRFEHSMVEYDGNLYVFGGASKDKSYLSETWKLNTGYKTFAQGFAYRRKVEVNGLDDLDSVPDSQMVEVHIPSAAWMEGGKLQADCEDLLFLTEDGERMDFWVEPTGAPYGCGAETTKVWVEVTDGADDFHMYYGNKGFKSYSSPSVFAKDGIGMFEDFEFEGSPLDNGWALDGTEHDTCTPLEPGKMGDASSFFTSEDVSLTGERSLAVDAYSKIGGSIKKAGGAGLEKSFILKGFFYDTMCSGFHYLSPDFDVCQPVQNAKSMLPDTKNAMGVYTDAKADEYCYTYPWIKSGADRSVGWHSFTFVGSEDELNLYVDEEWVATTEPTDFSSIFIAGGMFVDDLTAGTKAYWDSLLVTANYAGVSSEVEDEEAVLFDEAHQWVQVGLVDAPPARQAHSAVVFDDSMYIFGGERSSYEYSDIWKFSFEDGTWEFVAPRNSSAALGRHDHSAVVYDDVMYVYGGRSPAPKGDFWAYSFEEGTWTEMPSSPGMAPRFGHGATVIDDAMYVYGGYSQGMDGGLTDEVWSFSFEEMKWTKVGPRLDNFMEGTEKAYIASPYDAMQFPQMLPDARFSSVLLGRSATKSFYILGGAGGDSMMELLSDVAGFSTEMKEWSVPTPGFNEVEELGRYDAAGALIDDMWACTFGGLGEGEFLQSTVCVFIGDMGLAESS